jgi:DNA-binding LacI/PurR family transcriptional regulator
MSHFKILSASEQIMVHLRGEIARGRWSERMPGRNELARQLGVGSTNVDVALRQLEAEGQLVAQGAGRMRRIAATAQYSDKRRLRVAILAYEKSTQNESILSETVHVLREAGHDAFFTRSSLLEMGMNVKRIASLVEKTEADAWIVCSAPREITEWFAQRPEPAFALFGRRRGVRLASVGPDKAPAYAAAARRLIELGHKRIVLLCRTDRRLPVPGTPERAFLAELESHGIRPEPYHLPNWQDGSIGFRMRLERLFQVTPPTALMVDEMMLFMATHQFLVRKKLSVPEDVSLVSMESDPAFDWCSPAVARVDWDHQPVLRRVMSWVNNIASGKKDLRETLTGAKFIDGGTVGPVKS